MKSNEMFSSQSIFFILALSLVVVGAFSLTIGAYPLSLQELFAALLGDSSLINDTQLYLVWQIRLPRMVMGALVGAGLAVAGAAVQGLFRNPLADPGLIGVTGGAMLFAVLFIVLDITWLSWAWLRYMGLAVFAFLGSLLAVFMVYWLATSKGKTYTITMLLGGVAITAITGAIAGFFIYFSDEEQLRDITFWSMGSLGGASWEMVLCLLPFWIISMVILLQLSKPLNGLLLGEQEAVLIGVNVQRTKGLVVFAAAFMVGACVAMTGMIGFVGLVVPHLVRMSFGANHKIVLGASVFLGAILLIIADMLARIIVLPAELPIGIVTALIGGPFFFWLLLQSKKKNTVVL